MKNKKTKSLKKRKAVIKRRVRATKPVHKRILLHPVGIMITLCTGVLIAGWTIKTVSDSYSLTATVSATNLTTGAYIVSPSDGATVTTSPIIVSGSCPINSYVILTINSVFSGVAYCSGQGNFQITTSLSAGTNVLKAQDYSQTNTAGPSTPSISIFYSPQPTAVGVSPSQSSISKTSTGHNNFSQVPPLALTSSFQYFSFPINSPFTWSLTINGGAQPYSIIIDWSDGQSSKMSTTSASSFTIKHIYHKSGYYPVKATVTDSSGQSATLQLAALIRGAGLNAYISNLNPKIPNATKFNLWSFLQNQKWLIYAWPAYTIVVLMLVSYWLGEREEIKKILNPRKNGRLRHT